jgi:hypothetical protein
MRLKKAFCGACGDGQSVGSAEEQGCGRPERSNRRNILPVKQNDDPGRPQDEQSARDVMGRITKEAGEREKMKSNESKLEAIQMAWHEEWEDRQR